jgi:hypothetical protein
MDGGRVTATNTFYSNTPAYNIAAVGDYNADGMSDLLVRDSGNNNLIEFFVDTDHLVTSVNLGQVPSDWLIA